MPKKLTLRRSRAPPSCRASRGRAASPSRSSGRPRAPFFLSAERPQNVKNIDVSRPAAGRAGRDHESGEHLVEVAAEDDERRPGRRRCARAARRACVSISPRRALAAARPRPQRRPADRSAVSLPCALPGRCGVHRGRLLRASSGPMVVERCRCGSTDQAASLADAVKKAARSSVLVRAVLVPRRLRVRRRGRAAAARPGSGTRTRRGTRCRWIPQVAANFASSCGSSKSSRRSRIM